MCAVWSHDYAPSLLAQSRVFQLRRRAPSVNIDKTIAAIHDGGMPFLFDIAIIARKRALSDARNASPCDDSETCADAAERSAGCERQIILSETAAPKRDCDASRRRAASCWRWRESQRAGFGDVGVEMDVGFGGERRARIARDGDQPRALTLDQRDDHQKLRAFSRIRQGDHHVVARNHAQVAVAGFGGMDEECRSAGACQGGRNLAGDVAGLADSADYNAPSAEHDFECTHELYRQLRSSHGARLDLDTVDQRDRLGRRIFTSAVWYRV